MTYVHTEVVHERGQWFVDIIVVFEDEVVRRRISGYRSEKLALIAADLVRRGADRDIAGPVHGMG